MPRWTREAIIAEILHRYESGFDLSYSAIAREHLALQRAAVRYFGSWEEAVVGAGIDYAAIRRYKSWTPVKIVARIQELHAGGHDLSWRHVSGTLDPSLAAAATKPAHFGSWQRALEAAGIDYAAVRRYRHWSEAEVVSRLRERVAAGLPLSARAVERDDMALVTAGRRCFRSWDRALAAASIDYRLVVERAPHRRRRPGTERSAPTP